MVIADCNVLGFTFDSDCEASPLALFGGLSFLFGSGLSILTGDVLLSGFPVSESGGKPADAENQHENQNPGNCSLFHICSYPFFRYLPGQNKYKHSRRRVSIKKLHFSNEAKTKCLPEVSDGGFEHADVVISGDVFVEIPAHALGVAHLAEDPSVG